MVEEFTEGDLFTLKSNIEAQLERDYVTGTSAQLDGAIDFLVGDWKLVVGSFGANGRI